MSLIPSSVKTNKKHKANDFKWFSLALNELADETNYYDMFLLIGHF
jgi:hypothetical protein